MHRFLLTAALLLGLAGSAAAAVEPFPALLAKTGKLTIPVLAVGANSSFGTGMASDLRFVATDVTALVIPNSGHWLMEEQPAATVAAVTNFLR